MYSMSPLTKRPMKPGSSRSKNPKLYDTGPFSAAGSSTTIALWPKRSKKISPGCIVMTPMRGVAKAAVAKSHSAQATSSRIRRSGVGMHADMQGVQAARIGAGHAEAEAAQREFLAGFRQVADRGGEQAADGVVFVVVEIGAEAFVKIADGRERIDHEMAVGLRCDQLVIVGGVVVLVVDLADDLFQHVLDGDQAGDAAVFV